MDLMDSYARIGFYLTVFIGIFGLISGIVMNKKYEKDEKYEKWDI